MLTINTTLTTAIFPRTALIGIHKIGACVRAILDTGALIDLVCSTEIEAGAVEHALIDNILVQGLVRALPIDRDEDGNDVILKNTDDSFPVRMRITDFTSIYELSKGRYLCMLKNGAKVYVEPEMTLDIFAQNYDDEEVFIDTKTPAGRAVAIAETLPEYVGVSAEVCGDKTTAIFRAGKTEYKISFFGLTDEQISDRLVKFCKNPESAERVA